MSTRQDQRITELMRDLSELHTRGAGEDGLPVVTPVDAARIASRLHHEADALVVARDKLAATQQLSIACERGCSDCCERLITVLAPEAIAVARWLSGAAGAAARKSFLTTYPKWKSEIGDAPQRVTACLTRGDNNSFGEVLREVKAKRIMCAFNQAGVCTIYPVRPNICRIAHALETSEHCASMDRAPAVLNYTPIDEFLGRPVVFATHVSVLQDMRGPAPLCTAVRDYLHEMDKPVIAKVGRNAPCPCGSGLKHKRCCGG